MGQRPSTIASALPEGRGGADASRVDGAGVEMEAFGMQAVALKARGSN
jgi:hypothetical protein